MYAILMISVLFIIPLCIMSYYNHPSADDYGYAILTKKVWDETGSIFAVLKMAVSTSIKFYNEWQGLYSSAFFLALQPGLFGEEYYVLTGYIMLFIIIGSTTYFTVYMSKQIGGTKMEALTISAGMLFIMFQFMPSVVQGVYWFNGAVNYVFFHGLLLLFICCMIELQKEMSIRKRIFLCFLGACIVILVEGGNHTTTLMGAVFPILVLVYDLFFKKHRHIISNLIMSGVALIGLAANVMAPGTAVRQRALEGYDAFYSIYLSIIYGIYRVFELFDLKVMIVSIILLPVIVSMVQPLIKRGFKFSYPIIVFIFSVGWIACMLVPPFYGMGSAGPDRLANVVYFQFIILTFINIFYFVGWIVCRLKLEGKLLEINWSWCLAMCVLAFGLYVNSKNDMWSVKAVEELRQNIPQQLSLEVYKRDELLKQSKGEAVLVDEFSVKSELLYYGGITNDPDYWCNEQTAQYYELESVATK